MFRVNGFVSRKRHTQIWKILEFSEMDFDVLIFMFRINDFVSRIRQTQTWNIKKSHESDFDGYTYIADPLK